MLDLETFQKVDMRVGTIVEASLNEKARKPAYKLKVDLGEELGIKSTSAQITDLYECESLVGRKVIAVVNFPPLQVASVKSEVLVLGSLSDQGVVLLQAGDEAKNGDKVA
ncbi:tRNA-binding protein [Erysipelothrix inopinata]|uniref:tRNA-binding protein n=1 Tax=Erysipelothrix inopinata TaxID=225084 RepID=A0A7G9S0J7_9FIRM|nr:tRNA-binding protein [Erysipelothrix inopinata]QNN61372.1 tRNA-binding protein [Erysipelothrix inopinata]